MNTDVITEKMWKDFYFAIKGTLLAEIIALPENEISEPKMKLGPEPNHKLLGHMTEFEKKCFTLLGRSWKESQRLSYEVNKKYFARLTAENETKFQQMMSEATDKNVRQNQIMNELKSCCDDGLYELQIKESKGRVAALNGILCETIKDRLKLQRGGNIRYYVCAGYQIASETGILDKPKKMEKISAEEIAEATSLKSLNETKNDDGFSSISEALCVLF